LQQLSSSDGQLVEQEDEDEETEEEQEEDDKDCLHLDFTKRESNNSTLAIII
jgi:hypothetical protein